MAEFEVYRREKKYHVHEIILKWIVDITMVVCLSFILATYMLGKTTVVGHSMEPTLENDDSLLVDKVSFCFGQPKRYDVIVFEPAIANVSKYYVKRIVGLPGETVQIMDGIVYIDGEKINMSPKEYDLLFYMAENHNIALTREKLISEVWGYDYYGDARTLDTHVKLLRRSLGRYASCIVTVRGVGYRFEG